MSNTTHNPGFKMSMCIILLSELLATEMVEIELQAYTTRKFAWKLLLSCRYDSSSVWLWRDPCSIDRCIRNWLFTAAELSNFSANRMMHQRLDDTMELKPPPQVTHLKGCHPGRQLRARMKKPSKDEKIQTKCEADDRRMHHKRCWSVKAKKGASWLAGCDRLCRTMLSYSSWRCERKPS